MRWQAHEFSFKSHILEQFFSLGCSEMLIHPLSLSFSLTFQLNAGNMATLFHFNIKFWEVENPRIQYQIICWGISFDFLPLFWDLDPKTLKVFLTCKMRFNFIRIWEFLIYFECRFYDAPRISLCMSHFLSFQTNSSPVLIFTFVEFTWHDIINVQMMISLQNEEKILLKLMTHI